MKINKIAVLFFCFVVSYHFSLKANCAFSSVTTPINAMKLLEVIDNQIIALREKNIPKAYYAFTSDRFRQATTLNDFEKLVQHFPALHDNKTVALTAIHFLDDEAFYEGTISSFDGNSLGIEYILVKDGENWKINGLKVKEIIYKEKDGEKLKKRQKKK